MNPLLQRIWDEARGCWRWIALETAVAVAVVGGFIVLTLPTGHEAMPTPRSQAKAADWPTVHLDTPADLERLRTANTDHYARAVRLMAAADRLCKRGEQKLQDTDGRDISCDMTLLTSNPPKRRVSFTLDETHYVAIVTITANPGHLALIR